MNERAPHAPSGAGNHHPQVGIFTGHGLLFLHSGYSGALYGQQHGQASRPGDTRFFLSLKRRIIF
jgi:hypothetical protein